MAQYRPTLAPSTGWIHELAKAEIHPEARKMLQLGDSLDPQQLVEESTVDFLTDLRDALEEHVQIFNGYSEQGKRFGEVKIYSLAQAPADFMLFRNQVKLIFSNSAHGVIQVSFASHERGKIDNRQASEKEAKAHFGKPQELMALVGPFKNVYWTFQGERVGHEEVAKFYFAEFIRSTRVVNRSKLGRELLLEEVKTFLQAKGIDV